MICDSYRGSWLAVIVSASSTLGHYPLLQHPVACRDTFLGAGLRRVFRSRRLREILGLVAASDGGHRTFQPRKYRILGNFKAQ